MRFQAILEQSGKTATGIEVPGQVLETLGAGKRPAVRVTINGYSYPSTVGSMGGRSLLPVSAAVRAGAGVSAGDLLDVEVELDTAPREVAIPPDLDAALGAGSAARRAFDALSYSAKQRVVLPIEQTKGAETRQRRVARAVQELEAAGA